MMRLAVDEYGTKIPCFTPRTGVTLEETLVPKGDIKYGEVYKIGADVEITIDGISVIYSAGDEICFANGTSYTFSAPTPAHKM